MDDKDLCDFCGGELKRGLIDLELKIKGERVICRGVPADVCGQCEEWYIGAETSRKLDMFLKVRKKEKPERYIPVPIFSPKTVFGKKGKNFGDPG